MALDDALDRLSLIWTRNDAYRTAHAGEPSTSQEVRHRLEGLGYPISDEVVTWFSWHGGVAHLNRRLGPALDSMTVDEALHYRVINLEVSERLREAELPEEAMWQPAWLPIINLPHGGNFAADLAGGDATTSPVWRDDEASPHRQVAESLEQMVNGWIELIEDGYWSWDSQQRDWVQGSAQPPELLARLDV